MTSAMRGEVFRRDGLARRHDERLDGFTSIRGPHSDDGGLTHMRMKRENLLDFGRVYVQPGGRQDHVLLPIDDVEEAVLIHTCDVAGGEPATGFHSVRGPEWLV